MSVGTALGIPTVQTLADLRALVSVPFPRALRVYVRAEKSVVVWDPSSSETDDSDLVIRPTDRSSMGGRWVRTSPKLSGGALLDDPFTVYGDGRQLVCDTNVNATGGFVDSWVDNLAGSWAQAATARPALSLGTGPNGLNEVIADGSNDNLILTGLDFPAPSVGAPIYIVTVFKHITAGAAGRRLFGSSDDRLILYTVGGGNTWTMFDGANGPAAAVPDNAYCFLEMLFTGSAADFIAVNGAAPVTGNSSNSNPAANFAIFGNTGGGFTNSAMGLFYVRQNAAGAGTTSERNRVRAYANAKFALSVAMLP